MYAPGGFNATIEDMAHPGRLRQNQLIDHLPKHYTCIVFDAANATVEAAVSGRRVTWAHYVAQGKGLLDPRHRAPTSWAAAWAARSRRSGSPSAGDAGMILFWPVGGAKRASTAISVSPSTWVSCGSTGSPRSSRWSPGQPSFGAAKGRIRGRIDDPLRPRLRCVLRKARHRAVPARRRRHGAHAARPRHRAGRRSRRTCCGSIFRR